MVPNHLELQQVIEDFNLAQSLNYEELLQTQHSHAILFRNNTYLDALKHGIDANSNDEIRLECIYKVIYYIYHNIEPPNQYTKKTDRMHFIDVGMYVKKFALQSNHSPSISLIIAAWFHDIERYIPETKCRYLPESVDQYRKQVIHGMRSANIAKTLLKGAPLNNEELQLIYQLILYHDNPNPTQNVIILDKILLNGAKEKKLVTELQYLQDADAFTFFLTTMPIFITYKSKKNSKEWIWKRIIMNINRLRPHLRKNAYDFIMKLPPSITQKIAFDSKELHQICNISETFTNSAYMYLLFILFNIVIIGFVVSMTN